MILSVIPGLRFGPVLSFLFNSVVGFEHGVVSDLFLSLVEDFIFVGVSNLNLLFVCSFTVWSGQVVNLGPPPVFFFLSVENIVYGLIRNNWDISVVGLGVGVVDDPWLFCVLGEMLDSVEGFVLGGVPLFILSSVLGFSLGVSVRNWNLPCPDFSLNFVGNLVLSLVIGDWDINNLFLLNIVYMGVNVVMVVATEFRKWLYDSESWLSVCWCREYWCRLYYWCRVSVVERWE